MGQKRTFSYILSILLCLEIFSTTPPAAARSRYWPTGVQLGTEVANPLYYKYYRKQIDEQYEFNASIDIARLLVEGDYGWGSGRQQVHNHQENTSSVYTNKGKYFRAGLNYNLVPDTPNRNAAFLGVKYARSFLQSSHGTTDLATRRVTADWYEVVAGVKIKVWGVFYVGGTVRYKLGLSLNKDLHSQHLWGWGACDKGDDVTLGITYYISLRIPFERCRVSQNNSPEK